eukprot:SAG11_NODE_3382_length_2485_cov_1.076278_3_plen_23_part_01
MPPRPANREIAKFQYGAIFLFHA